VTTFSVILATYGRPELLAKCLEGLRAQTRVPDEVIVVTRLHDVESQDVVKNSPLHPTVVHVEIPGVLAALAQGLSASTGNWVAFTDDDAVPSVQWLEGLERLAQQGGVVGVGGRDVLEDDGVVRPTSLTSEVGTIGAFGRFVGNHHCGDGGARHVSMLKGVNCAYDATFLGIPSGLYGEGAQAHFEIAIGLDLAKVGSLLYDPRVTVRHAPGTRRDGDQRVLPSRRSIADVASNAVLACSVRSWSFALRRTLYSIVVGDASCPGVLRVISSLTQADLRRRFIPSVYGSLRGLVRASLGGVTFVRR